MKLTVNNLNEQAYNILKGKILGRELPPGTRLVDSQLAEEFGISRTPLRDAIRKLSEEGLVVNSSKRGYFVFQPTRRDIDEIFALREILELAAAKILIERILPGNEEAYRILTASFEKGIRSAGELSSFAENDEDFHDTIVALTGNARMTAWYTDLKNQNRSIRRITSSDKSRVQTAQEYHSKIYEGLEALDYAMTTEAIKQHICYSRRDALQDFIPEED